MLIPAARFSTSNAMCKEEPGPPLPSVSSPGLARAALIRSATVRYGEALLMTRTIGIGGKMANRLEIFRRIIIYLSQSRIDDERRRHDQDRVSVRSRTCHGFLSRSPCRPRGDFPQKPSVRWRGRFARQEGARGYRDRSPARKESTILIVLADLPSSRQRWTSKETEK